MKQLIINYLKNFWKVYLVFFTILFIFAFSVLFQDLSRNISNVLLYCIVYPFLILLGYIPAIVYLYFVFKATKSVFLRILSLLFIFPLTDILYILIFDDYGIYLYLLSLLLSFFGFFITLFIPKKILSFKKWVLISEVLLFITFLFIGILYVHNNVDNYEEYIKNELENFNPVISYIEDYKLKNGKYPEKMNQVKIYSAEFPYLEYEAFDNGKDYMLRVFEHKYFEYHYCSDKKYTGCHEGRDGGAYYSEFDNWIKMEID